MRDVDLVGGDIRGEVDFKTTPRCRSIWMSLSWA